MTKLSKVFRYGIILQIVALMVVVLSVLCCGRKAPPVPPHQEAVPAVTDLESRIEGENIILTWSVPDSNKKESLTIAGFVIYQAKYDISEKICEDCPINYKPLSEIDAQDFKVKDRKIKCVIQPDKGFKYFFKVTAYSKNMASESKDSNIIKLDY